MPRERWQQVEHVYNAVISRPARERSSALAELCATDEALRHEVESLLAHVGEASAFLATPAWVGTGVPEGPTFVGRRFGAYAVLAPLGAGGMGEVYRARDEQLGRDVAIKILPRFFSSHPERLARFENEARMLAALNHPHIGAIYGLERVDGVPALVLELVEGETLAERIAKSRLAPADALTIARQIAEALEAAHARGIVHRDLKPANIKITPDGVVKVLDFGLAKLGAGEPGGTGAGLTHSPTVINGGTRDGAILGTIAYMSPEQAAGKVADKRSDLWAFGVVLLEMLTGRIVFTGETESEVLAAVLTSEPDWTMLPAETPAPIRTLLRRCLEKDRTRRLDSATAARLEIDDVLTAPAAEPRARAAVRLPWTAAVTVAAVFALALVWAFKPTEPVRAVEIPFFVPDNQNFNPIRTSSVAISPDGTHVAYVAGGTIYLGDPTAMAPRPIPGIQGGGLGQPVFSPDGRSLVYLNAGLNVRSLKKIPVVGGIAETLIDNSPDPVLGVSWTTSDRILFASRKGIEEIPAAGGTPPHLLIAARDGERLGSPEMLPDGESVLFSAATADWDSAKIYVQALKSGDRKLVWNGGGDPHYIPTGHVVFAHGNMLFALPFDLDTFKGGAPTTIVEGIRRSLDGATDTGNYDISETGRLVYVLETAPLSMADSVLALVDGDGVQTRLAVPPKQYRSPRFSPKDGMRLAVEAVGSDLNSHIWIYDRSGHDGIRQLTRTGSNTRPIWTPDGRSVTFGSNRDGTWRIYSQRVDETAGPESLTTGEPGIPLYPESWSLDGRALSYVKVVARAWSIWTYSADSGKSELFHQTPGGFNDYGSVFSPDGHFIAYSTAGPTGGVSVQSFPGKDASQLVAQGGMWPVWPQQDKLFIRQRLGNQQQVVQLSIVKVSTKGGFTYGNTPGVRAVPNALSFQDYRAWDVAPDGTQFVVIVPADASSAAPPPPHGRINIVLNWSEKLKAGGPLR